MQSESFHNICVREFPKIKFLYFNEIIENPFEWAVRFHDNEKELIPYIINVKRGVSITPKLTEIPAHSYEQLTDVIIKAQSLYVLFI